MTTPAPPRPVQPPTNREDTAQRPTPPPAAGTRRVTARQRATWEALCAWADRNHLPVTTRQLDSMALEVEAAIRRLEPRGPRPTVSPKPRADAAAAREIAAQIEAGFAPRPGQARQ